MYDLGFFLALLLPSARRRESPEFGFSEWREDGCGKKMKGEEWEHTMGGGRGSQTSAPACSPRAT